MRKAYSTLWEMQSRAEEVGVAFNLYVALFTEEHMTEHTAQEKQQVWWLTSLGVVGKQLLWVASYYRMLGGH